MNDTLDKFYSMNKRRLSDRAQIDDDEIVDAKQSRVKRLQQQMIEEENSRNSASSKSRTAPQNPSFPVSRTNSKQNRPSRFVESSFETSFVFNSQYKPFINKVPMFEDGGSDDEDNEEDYIASQSKTQPVNMYQRKSGNTQRQPDQSMTQKPVTAHTSRFVQQQREVPERNAPKSAPINRPKPNFANLALLKQNMGPTRNGTQPDNNSQLSRTQQINRNMVTKKPITGVSSRTFALQSDDESEDESDEEDYSPPPTKYVPKQAPQKRSAIVRSDEEDSSDQEYEQAKVPPKKVTAAPPKRAPSVSKPIVTKKSTKYSDDEESDEEPYPVKRAPLQKKIPPKVSSTPPPKKPVTNNKKPAMKKEQDDSDEGEGLSAPPQPDFEAMIKEAEQEDDVDADFETVECDHCGRKFREDRLEKHRKICLKSKSKKRKVFTVNPVSAEAAQLKKKESKNLDARELPVSKIPKWKIQRELFRKAVLGKSSTTSDNQQFGSEAFSQEDLDDRVPCGHCGRKFNFDVYERHSKVCHKRTAIQPKSNARNPPPPKNQSSTLSSARTNSAQPKKRGTGITSTTSRVNNRMR
jgi:hypothetical protein